MPQTAMRLAGKHKHALPKRLAFTIDALNAATCPAGKDREYLYDTNSPLALAVTAGGSKVFYRYAWVKGGPQRVRIGAFPDLSIEQARKLVRVIVGEVAAGADPLAERREARAQGMNLGELWEWFLEGHAKLRKRSWAADKSRWDNWLKPWSTRRLNDLTRMDVAALHRRIATEKSQATANRVLALLRKMLNAAKQIGWENPNPCEGVEQFSESSRERFLSADEMPRFLEALDAPATDPDWRDFFKLALFTGARRSNLLSMRWDEIDLTAARWTIPAAKFKNGKATTVYLASPAIATLKARKTAQGKHSSEWVFPTEDGNGGSDSGHLAKPDHAWAELCTRAKLDGLHIHDLRRSLGSWQAAAGASLSIIGKSLGHRSIQATQIYARLDLDPVARSIDTAIAAMTAKPKQQKGK